MNIRKLILIAITVFFSLNVQAIDIKSKLIELNQRPIACGVIGGVLGTASYFAYKACERKFNLSQKNAPMVEKTKVRLVSLNKKPILCGIIGVMIGTSVGMAYKYFVPKDIGYKVIEL